MTEIFDYDSYINSEAWRNKANRIRRRDGYRCRICGADSVPLEVHHLTYDRLYQEPDDNLLTVCHKCHEKITESWHDMKDGVKARNVFLRELLHSYECAEEYARYLNAMMPHDISFGGAYVLSSYNDIKMACADEGIEYKHALKIQQVFNRIHVLDVVTKINSGMPRWALIDAGYPKSLIQKIAERQEQNEDMVATVSDELICFMHDGDGEWIVTASEDGLETGFKVRFMPYKRYQNRWWDS